MRNNVEKVIIMKKMRGIVDPISLGFILSTLIVGIGVTTTNNNIETGNIAKVKVEASQNTTITHALKSTPQQSSYSIYNY